MTSRLLRGCAIGIMLLTSLMGCALFGRGNEAVAQRSVRPGDPKVSPSGQYTAYAEYGTPQNTVKTWVDVIKDKNGKEVFRDDTAYSTRHSIMFTWISTQPNELWILSGDVGTFYVTRWPDGNWVKQHATNVPKEIKDLRGY
ncbi:hypothetical protein ACAG26_20865 [Mycobacterium sp. pUA109]|uniref:hypothetical protein n=1 Tax=Mycobacterium sp. pUA109 TaxID=3238982 RepID=UPI00351B3350